MIRSWWRSFKGFFVSGVVVPLLPSAVGTATTFEDTTCFRTTGRGSTFTERCRNHDPLSQAAHTVLARGNLSAEFFRNFYERHEDKLVGKNEQRIDKRRVLLLLAEEEGGKGSLVEHKARRAPLRALSFISTYSWRAALPPPPFLPGCTITFVAQKDVQLYLFL